MGDKTAIGWTDATWNPVAGCSIVSPGCKNCYAMQWANRMLDKPGSHYHGTTKLVNSKAVWTGAIGRAPDHIFYQPLHWKRPRRIFVNSMGDLFHEDIDDELIDEVFAVMALAPQHQFQVLTKRADRMAKYMDAQQQPARVIKVGNEVLRLCHRFKKPARVMVSADGKQVDWPLPNVWLGVSAEDQERWDERVHYLRHIPAAVRFVSVEPQIGEIVPDLSGLHWVIVGGESGPGARPFNIEWAVEMEMACAEAGVAFFMKQMGSRPLLFGQPNSLIKHKKGERVEEWPLRLQVQEFPKELI